MDRPVVRPAVFRNLGPRRHRRPRSSARFVVLIAVGALACQPSADHVPEPLGGVPMVIDGDSLNVTVNNETLEVRLDGINAPESDECLAEQARTRLQQLADARVEIEATGTDQFGRTLGLIRSTQNPPELLNEVMVAEGLALANTGGNWSDRFIAAEEEARRTQLGMWSPTACGPEIDADIRIEFSQPNPPGADRPDAEFITIHNDGPAPINLSGFVLRDESSSNRLPLPTGTTLVAGDSIEVWTGCEPASGLGWCSDTPIWNNGGDSALLLSPFGNVVAHARYDPGR